MTAIIELDDLRVAFGKRMILHGLTAQLKGRAVGLLGPNGAGKTTLIHTLLGFHAPASGTARIFGQDIQQLSRTARAEIGYMPERDAFIAEMSCVGFVRMMGELAGLPSETALERAHEALFYVGLGEARYRSVATYSLGMKQLAKLAQALVHGPRLVILDEPTNGLDPPARQRMIDLIRALRDGGQTHILLSSHLLRDVEECCDEILILKDGRIAHLSALADSRAADERLLEVELHGDRTRFAAAAQEIGCVTALAGRQRVKLVLPANVGVRELYSIAAAQNAQLRRVNYKQNSLEDIFLQAME